MSEEFSGFPTEGLEFLLPPLHMRYARSSEQSPLFLRLHSFAHQVGPKTHGELRQRRKHALGPSSDCIP